MVNPKQEAKGLVEEGKVHQILGDRRRTESDYGRLSYFFCLV